MKQEPGKRIVSKEEYAGILVRRATMRSVGILAGVSAIVFGGLGLICLSYFVEDILLLLAGHPLSGDEAFWGVLCALSGWGAYHAATMGTACITCSRTMEQVLPLTRANIGDLPAPESLVRASAEPVQEQQAILLRAATEGEQTPVEQLVRPSRGQK